MIKAAFPSLLFILVFAACEVPTEPTGPPLFQQVEDSGVESENRLVPTEAFNIITYLYYYNGGGVAATDINGDGLADLYFTNNQRENRYYVNEGNWRFRDATEEAGLGGSGDWSTGVSVTDVNRDGLADIYVCNVAGYLDLRGGNELFIQQADGGFREAAAEYGLDFTGFATQAYWFDYDDDGDQDMYLLCHSVHNDATYGPASFRQNPDPVAGDRLYRCEVDEKGQVFYRHVDGEHLVGGGLHGQQAASSAAVVGESGIFGSKIGYGLSAAVADFNEDRRPDLYVCNDFSENDYLYWNTGNDSLAFREGIRASMGHSSNFSMGSDVGDFDNDGRPDLFTLDMRPADEYTLKHTVSSDPFNIYRIKRNYGYHHQYPRNNLQWNRGGGRFSEIGLASGTAASDWSWSALIADYDLDGKEDIFVSNGIWRRPNDLDYLKFVADAERADRATNLELADQMPSGTVPNVLFRNEGTLRFREAAAEWGLDLKGSTNGAATADLDGDGDLDLVLNNLNAPATLYRNDRRSQPLADSLALELPQMKGTHLLAFDSLVVVSWTAELAGQPLYLELSDGGFRYIPTVSQRGFQSQSERRWLGVLPAGVRPVKLMLRRPRNSDGNTRMSLRDRLAGQENPPPATEGLRLTLLGLPDVPRLYFLAVEENEYTDFDAEPLQPWMVSDQGPAVAVGTVDGSEIVFVGGSHGNAGVFLRARTNFFPVRSHFSPTSDLGKDAPYEDTGAAFFDADGDGDQDLYVVSGGMQTNIPTEYLEDRLYLNVRGLQFERCADCLPTDFTSQGSSVVAADFDADGDIDVFVGGRGVAGEYGRAGQSRVLLNNGEGRFTYDASWTDVELGMVTDATWLEGYPALAVVGEWMSITLFYPEAGGWRKEVIPNSSGLWRRINRAGPMSFAVGNWGENSVLGAPSMDDPLRLYVSDLDGNGKVDPIITYVKEGEEMTLSDKDELSTQLPSWRKNNLNYRDFAGRDFTTNFSGWDTGSPLTAETVAHRWYFRKDGSGKWPFVSFGPKITSLNDWVYRSNGTHSFYAGNDLNVLPRVGRQDAAALSLSFAEIGEAGLASELMPNPFEVVHRMVLLSDGAILVIGNTKR